MTNRQDKIARVLMPPRKGDVAERKREKAELAKQLKKKALRPSKSIGECGAYWLYVPNNQRHGC